MPPCTCSADDGHVPAGVGGVGPWPSRRPAGGVSGLGLGGPRRPQGDRARALGLAQACRRNGATPPGRRRSGDRTACGRGRIPRPSPSCAGQTPTQLRRDRQAQMRSHAGQTSASSASPSPFARTRAKRRVASIVSTGSMSQADGSCRAATGPSGLSESSTITSAESASGTTAPPRLARSRRRRAPRRTRCRAATWPSAPVSRRAGAPGRPPRWRGRARAPARSRAPRIRITSSTVPSPWPPCSSSMKMPGQPSSASSAKCASS